MEFVFIGLLLLSFPIIAIVALVRSFNLAERLYGDPDGVLEPERTAGRFHS